jgi:hypothetical protein
MSDPVPEVTCKFCNAPFRYEHVRTRHESTHCLKRKQITTNYRENIQEITDRINKLHRDFFKESMFDIKDAASEVLTDELHEINTLIAVKNLNRIYQYKCSECNEGFEYERQQLEHQLTCVFRKFDNLNQNSMDTNSQSTSTSSTSAKQTVKISSKVQVQTQTQAPASGESPSLLDLKKSIDALSNELNLIVREIKQLQEGHTKLREQCSIVEKTKDQLNNLHDIKFQLELFKAAALKNFG